MVKVTMNRQHRKILLLVYIICVHILLYRLIHGHVISQHFELMEHLNDHYWNKRPNFRAISPIACISRLLTSKTKMFSFNPKTYKCHIQEHDCSDLEEVSLIKEMGWLNFCRKDLMQVCTAECDVPSYIHKASNWRVIQKRINGKENFARPWNDYKAGFGTSNHEFWIGHDNLHNLTSHGFTYLRIDMEDKGGDTAFAEYSTFKISNESQQYKITVHGYSGNAGDSMTAKHDGMKFSTFDRDNDELSLNFAGLYKGAWWYSDCHDSNLNGEYGNNQRGMGINWKTWHGLDYSLKSVTMAVRKP